MNKSSFDQLQLNAGFGFNPLNSQPQASLSTDLLNLSPKLMIAIGLGLLAFGVYRYYQAQPEKEV